MSVRLQVPFGTTVERVKAALKDQGFGVLTEIDVQATLKDKLDQDIEDYFILGACNPPLAYLPRTSPRTESAPCTPSSRTARCTTPWNTHPA